jgi:hypothetical protein
MFPSIKRNERREESMSRKAAKTYTIIIGAFSTTVAFIGTLMSDGIKEAFLMAIFVGLLIALVGAVGLRIAWKNEERE